MSGPLRTLAFCAYLISWLILAVAAAISAFSRRQTALHITMPVMVGTLLQVAGALVIPLSIAKGRLHPGKSELLGVLILAPLAAVLFVWALRSAPADSESLATTGAFAWLRHPIYSAFLAMLLATGLIASLELKMIGAVLLYLAGSELRIAAEEAELDHRFPSAYAGYRRETRWRYLPGLR